ncbi:type VI secretion system contractile sheath small subunit [Roseomonas sp. NAR14]|uniref:Type VI secretion system contractile sheath small subunit n=1 Tax=Roseomonas acroporae TaxID=2937791 RepID=A0A9X1Y521_9PROT|nr:type VI secretion system contractile sheath small subunit [Roseomonas acroporae]MCK8784369.1 type VI secretion system contractile sheath small subunit [Roseomonas acroporae]
MASEASVAPKERVNIRYKPATGDAREDVELPHKLLMLADFTGRADDTPLAERRRIDVNKDNFSDVLRNQNLALDLKVKDRLSDEPDAGEMAVSLRITSLKDFEPEQVARQVPAMQQLLELRQALMALKGPVGNMPAFRKAIERILADEALRQKVTAEISAAGEAAKGETA